MKYRYDVTVHGVYGAEVLEGEPAELSEAETLQGKASDLTAKTCESLNAPVLAVDNPVYTVTEELTPS